MNKIEEKKNDKSCNQRYKIRILKFIDNYKNEPAQKSPEWYKLKMETIGGSEVATVLGLNPYKNVKGLIADKLNISTFSGNLKTRWGNLFEEVTRTWVRTLLDMEEIYETGSIPGIIEGQRYSPDGLGIAELYDSNDQLTHFIILFEFKAPFSTIPNGKVPKHYMPQIQTGLMTIPMAHFAIFVNNSYRRCTLTDLNFNLTYDNKLDRYVNDKFTKVFGAGAIFVYQTKEQYKESARLCGYDIDKEDLYVSDDESVGISSDDSDDDDSDDDNGSVNSIDEDDRCNEDDHNEDKCNGDKRSEDDKDKYNKDTCKIKAGKKTKVNAWKAAKQVVEEIKAQYEIKDYDEEILLASVIYPQDFGACTSQKFNCLIELIDSKRISIRYGRTIVNYDETNNIPFIKMHKKEKQIHVNSEDVSKIVNTQMEQFKLECKEKGYNYMGVIPWKLFLTDIIDVQREAGWKEKIEPKIKETLEQIRKLKDKDIDEVRFEMKDKPTDINDEDLDITQFE